MSKVEEILKGFKKYEVHRINSDSELNSFAQLYEGRYTPYKGKMFPTGEYYSIADKETGDVYGGFEIITDAVVADRLYFGPICTYLFSDLNMSVNLKEFGAIYIAEMATTKVGEGKGAVTAVLQHLIRSGIPMFIYPTHDKTLRTCEQEGLTGYSGTSHVMLDNYPKIYSNVCQVFEAKQYNTMYVEYATDISMEVKLDAINWHRRFVQKDLTYEQQATFENLVLGVYNLTHLNDYR